MPRLRRLSGAEIIRILNRFGFTVHSQRGSHAKVRRELPDGTVQTLTVPTSRFIPEENLRPHFYSD